MKRALEILNALERAGVMRRYAIGGAMGATFYVEPLLTFELGVFVLLRRRPAGCSRSRRSMTLCAPAVTPRKASV